MEHIITWIKFVSLIVINVTAVIGNVVMVIVGIRNKLLRKFQNVFIFNMALADLLQGIFIMPAALANTYHGSRLMDKTGCFVFGVMKVAFTLSSVYSLAGISILRYFYVVKHTKRMNSMKSAACSVMCSWLISIFLSLTPLFDWGTIGFEDGKEVCTVLFHVTPSHTTAVFTTGLFLNVGIMVFCYANIFITLRKSSSNLLAKTPIRVSYSTQTAISQPIHRKVQSQNLAPANLSHVKLNIPDKGDYNNDSYVNNEDSFLHDSDKSGCNGVYEPRNNKYLAEHKSAMLDLNNTSILEKVENGSSNSHSPLQLSPLNSPSLSSIVSILRKSNKMVKTKITEKVKKQTNKRQRKQSIIDRLSAKELNLLKTISIVVVVFILCWLPYVLFNLIRMSGVVGDINAVDTVTMWLGFINSAVNPILYGLMNKQFRAAMKDVIFCR